MSAARPRRPVTDVPPANDEVPVVAAVYRGARALVVAATVSALVMSLLASGRPGGIPGDGWMALLGLLALTAAAMAAATGPAYLGVLTGALGSGGVAVAAAFTVVSAFPLVLAGYAVAFGAGGPRLRRRRAALYGGAVAAGWLPAHLLLSVLAWVGFGAPAAGLAVSLASILVAGTPFAVGFGALGGVLANR
jgi:hypothetical protein